MSDRIELRGVRAVGHHGVLPEERRDGQEFVVDLSLELDLRRPAATDELADTVNYADLAERVAAAVAAEPVQLIEALAARIVALCWSYPRVRAVAVTVHKPQAPVGVPFSDVAVRLERLRPRRAVIGLGANLDQPLIQLRRAALALSRLPGLTIEAVSGVYATEPVGRTQQPEFRNAVVLARTDLPAADLLEELLQIEARQGRVRDERWGPRRIDLDLIALGEERCQTPLLTLPHPRAAERAFVLAPWLEVDPGAVLTGVGPVEELLARIGRAGVRRTGDVLLPADTRGLGG